MRSEPTSTARATLLWAALILAAVVPITLAAFSPYLAWREPVYIASGFAGIAALALMLFQPLMAAGILPGLPLGSSRSIHRWVGAGILIAVIWHVVGLWITSPPDVVDALLFRSPTPFSVWGVIAMWALFATALLAIYRRRFRQNLRTWRIAHSTLAAVIVAGTVIHAALIEGTMETLSKFALSACVVTALGFALLRLRAWKRSSAKRA